MSVEGGAQAEDGIRDKLVTGVQTCALPILRIAPSSASTVALTVPFPPARSDTDGWVMETPRTVSTRTGIWDAAVPAFARMMVDPGRRPVSEIGRASCRERG